MASFDPINSSSRQQVIDLTNEENDEAPIERIGREEANQIIVKEAKES